MSSYHTGFRPFTLGRDEPPKARKNPPIEAGSGATPAGTTMYNPHMRLRPTSPSPSPRRTDWTLLAGIGALAGVSIALHLAGAMSLKHSLWGTHFFAFFAPPWVVIATLALGLAVAGLVVGGDRFAQTTGRVTLPRAIRVSCLVLAGIGLWLLRARNTYLGDGTILVSSIADGETFHPRQPLTMLLQQTLYRSLRLLFGADSRPAERVAQDTVALGSVVAGIAFVIVVGLLARELMRMRAPGGDEPGRSDVHTILLALVLLMQGYVQLFFGYVENYAFYALGVATYLWVSLRFLRGLGPLIVPAGVLVIGIAFHLASALLLPSLGALCIWAFARHDLRRSAVRDVAVSVALFFAIRFALTAWRHDYDLLSALLDAAGFAVNRRQELTPLFSSAHVRDVINEQLLIGPLGILLLAAGVMVAAPALRARGSMFLMVAALAHVGPAWLAGDSLARDWDLFAPAGLIFTAAGFALFLRRTQGRSGLLPGLACALLLSVYHTVPWIVVNASPDRGLARLKVLPLEFGQREVLVSQWYRSHGFDEERRAWLITALAINPGNTNAHHLLGVYYSERGDWESAARSFQHAVRVRPDKVLFRQLLVDALIRIGGDDEALPHLVFELSQNPGDPSRWVLYGEILHKLGRDADAAAAFQRALPLYQSLIAKEPEDYEANLACGWILHGLDRFEESLPYVRKALRVRPDSDSAECLLGFSLRSLDRTQEAVEHLRRCLELNPDRPDRDEIEAWLRGARP
jgi:Flp pilus assembly protein TadD